MIACRGVVNTFGIYQSYYEETLLSSHSASSISWIGTMQGFLLFLVGVLVGPIFDKGYLKSLIATGLFLVVFGLMMTSLSTRYWQVFLAHGVTVGIGCAFLFLPSIAIVATYFTSRRAIATGITASGGSIGKLSPGSQRGKYTNELQAL
jgi:MFS family permease